MTIVVTCIGHIKTSLGRERVELEDERMTALQLVERLREMGGSSPTLGFNQYNTLLVVNGEFAFTAATNNREIRDGDQVLLVPFSHGG